MLDRYPGFQSHDAEIARAVTLDHFRGTYFDIEKNGPPFFVKANWVSGEKFRLTSSSSHMPIEVGYEAETVLRQYFLLDASDGWNVKVGRDAWHVSMSSPSFIVPDHTPFRIDACGRHHALALRVEAGALNTMISALLGDDRPGVLTFDDQLQTAGDRRQLMRQAVLEAVVDLERMASTASATLLEAFGQMLVLKFLFYNRHSLSPALFQEPRQPSLIQGRRIEEFIEANWDGLLKIEDMARELSISARSIFRHFKKWRGVSPFEFQRNIRLSRVRTMLQLGDPDASVKSIALDCGFVSLGRFADDYRAKYGELPSETLRHARSRGRRN